MTTYSVKNEGHLDKAFRVYEGLQIVVAGSAGEVTTTEPLTEEQIAALAQDGVKVTEKKAAKVEPTADDKKA